MVPNGWEIKTLEQANITVTDGDRGKEYPKSSEFFDSGYCLFLSAKNLGFSSTLKIFSISLIDVESSNSFWK